MTPVDWHIPHTQAAIDPLDWQIAQVEELAERIWRETERRYADILAAARERWPEMVERPYIVPAGQGKHTLIAPGLVDMADGDHIELEPVGDFMLGYGPKSHVLYVGQKGE